MTKIPIEMFFGPSRKRRTSSLSTQLSRPVRLFPVPSQASTTTPTPPEVVTKIGAHLDSPVDSIETHGADTPSDLSTTQTRSYQTSLDSSPGWHGTVRGRRSEQNVNQEYHIPSGVGTPAFDEQWQLDPGDDRHESDGRTPPATSRRPGRDVNIASSTRDGNSEDDFENDSDSTNTGDQLPDLNQYDDERDEAQLQLQRCVDFIRGLLLLQDFGCGADAHRASLEKHMAEEDDDNHHTLSSTYDISSGKASKRPYNRGHPDVGLFTTEFPCPLERPRSRFMDSLTISRVVEGTVPDNDTTMNICLHNEYQPQVSLLQEFDIDSLLVFPKTLAALRTDVRLTFVKQTAYNIKTHLHLTRRVRFYDQNRKLRQETRSLKRIPHLYIGTVEEFSKSAIYVFFPRLINADNDGTWLTDHDASRFFDQLLIPTCRMFITDGACQHIVPSSQAANNKARAKGLEQQASERERGLRQFVDYTIQSTYLGEIWDELVSRIEDPSRGLGDFQDCFLFIDAKNLKGKYKARTILESFSKFDSQFRNTFHRDLVEFAVDVATEITPPQPQVTTLSTEVDTDAHEAVTCLWKACCLRTHLEKIRTHAFDGKQGVVNHYSNGFLRDAECMTVETPARSWVRKAGWIYGQWYNVSKEILDAQQVHPFSHPQLLDLCIDRSIFDASRKGATRKTLEKSYTESKRRVDEDTTNHISTSFGDRFEARITGPVFDLFLSDETAVAHPMSRLPVVPDYVWAVTTATWVDFVVGNYHKLTALLETAVLTSPTSGVELRTSRLIRALLLCVQQFGNSNIGRYPLLRRHTRDVEGVTQYGLGFEQSMSRRGFAWWSSICDWDRLRFRPELENHIIGGDRALGVWYRANTRLIEGTKDAVDFCYQYLRQNACGRAREQVVLCALAHIVLRQYRRDVLDKLEKLNELPGEWRSQDKKDEVFFSYDGLAEVLLQKPALASGNKTACKSVDAIFEWLMGVSPAWSRDVMDGLKPGGEQAPWRRLTTRALAVMQPARAQRWTNILRQEFERYLWVVPYPNSETGSFVHTVSKKGTRQFWASDHDVKSGRWVWSRNHPRPGVPMAYPRSLQMSTTELQRYFDEVQETLERP